MNELFTLENISLVLLLFVVIITVCSIIISSLKNGITPMPSSSRAADLIVKKAVKNIDDGVIIEAGSGWGLLSLKLARALPQCTVIGLENSMAPFLFSKLLNFIFKKKNLLFLKRDIYTYDYHNVDMIICYLYPGAMERLKIIFDDDSTSIKYLISNTFALPLSRTADKTEAHDLYQSPIYVYVSDKFKTSPPPGENS